MLVICLDLEGVLMPEVWVDVAERTGIPELRRTTRDEPDYDKLMRYRLDILDANGLTIDDITDVIEGMQPLEGAVEFLDYLRSKWQVIILSDTFSQFAGPMMDKLGRPTLLCHTLEIDEESHRITGWTIRLEDQKRRAVEALRGLNYNVIAAGDSYNDTSMLTIANAGILINPPSNVIDEFPQFPVTTDYGELLAAIEAAASDIGE
jgi:phosphoserine/homoserine phosphotransferase|tara:strand:+ start:966 stop:1583 length:618 start_codon:yes stop_codon:yes gene_type:complete